MNPVSLTSLASFYSLASCSEDRSEGSLVEHGGPPNITTQYCNAAVPAYAHDVDLVDVRVRRRRRDKACAQTVASKISRDAGRGSHPLYETGDVCAVNPIGLQCTRHREGPKERSGCNSGRIDPLLNGSSRAKSLDRDIRDADLNSKTLLVCLGFSDRHHEATLVEAQIFEVQRGEL